MPNLSPPCMKLETWLRLAGVPYELAPSSAGAPPKGKFPWVLLEDGAALGDSTLIIEHLKTTRGVDPDAGLSVEQRAISLAFRRTLKENTYWVMMESRYMDERNWPRYREYLHADLVHIPEPQRSAVPDAIKSTIQGQLHNHGLGRHTREEIHRIGIADMTAVSDYLGEKPFFMGDVPTTADATVYAHVANILDVPVTSPVKDFCASRKNLVRYCQRMRERYFSDLPRWDGRP